MSRDHRRAVGARKPPPEPQIRAMFDRIVKRYDLITTLLSFGLDGWWRRRAARAVHVQPGWPVLDLGCGTAKLGLLLAGRMRVIGVDVSWAMLSEARRRRQGGIALVQGSAFRLPFADATFGGAVSGFVLRNLDDLGAAFGELARVLTPGSTVALIDATEPRARIARFAFNAYFSTAALALGTLVGKRDAYRYLARSLVQIPPPRELCRQLRAAGFEACRARPLTGGVVTLFTARRGDRG